jgi:GNAT superfamily N-acetyltransferase
MVLKPRNQNLVGCCFMVSEEKSIVKSEEYRIKEYNQTDLKDLHEFFNTCLPESGRTMMCQAIISMAKDLGYREMYLDTISETSGRAIKMYQRLGFVMIEKYHETARSDVYMRLLLG